ncbi:hypothetical protein CY34DRAFT_804528 [Suillus luteus UH-Slu-Lm8-n1]|uniref:Uncharacterized protein n=1 Tax=Suillus luteus UH-Slu-Lm8-n1 TaxID=930992 RepID=A0A0D0BHY9_9AGAM|nr:hypothetical protein CY34DRAFT_804528 [Suillus luteus UH-Slu-Lm8-n1]
MGSNRSSGNGTNLMLNLQSHAHNATRMSKLLPGPSGLHPSRTLHHRLYAQTAELRKREENCFGNLYRVSLDFSTRLI